MDKQLVIKRADHLVGALRKLKQLRFAAGDHGIRHSELHFLWILAVLNKGEPVKPSEAAKELNVTLAAVTHHINSLEEKGLVSRLASSKDRRVTLIKLSDKGLKLVETLKKNRWKKICGLVEYLGEKESAELISLLDKISEYFEKAER